MLWWVKHGFLFMKEIVGTKDEWMLPQRPVYYGAAVQTTWNWMQNLSIQSNINTRISIKWEFTLINLNKKLVAIDSIHFQLHIADSLKRPVTQQMSRPQYKYLQKKVHRGRRGRVMTSYTFSKNIKTFMCCIKKRSILHAFNVLVVVQTCENWNESSRKYIKEIFIIWWRHYDVTILFSAAWSTYF